LAYCPDFAAASDDFGSVALLLPILAIEAR